MDRVVIRIYVEALELEKAVELKKAIDELLRDIPGATCDLTISPPARIPGR